ncbi:hypothetical protein A5N15_12090 [Rothia kristinae]|uniref:Diaminopimelate epimerase n=1 Tax=Rothia kristinae TaxID=37923 RepID=A0A657IUJ2_9MICC|nr:hypothetical protein A5N15_12090 [Rothia kristinae]
MTTESTTAESTTAQTDASRWGELAGVTLSKGHGTGNDFLLLTDPEGSLELEGTWWPPCATGTGGSARMG